MAIETTNTTPRQSRETGAATLQLKPRPTLQTPVETEPSSPPAPVDRVELSTETRQCLARQPWSNSRGLQGTTNAHRTNTREELDSALDGDDDWLEGDVREEIDRPGRLEMRHDQGQESGDNLTLAEWLEDGKRSGRGLKLDIKDSNFTPQILDEVKASGVPDDRLMFNLGYGEGQEYGQEIRKRFPEAVLALNPASDDLNQEELGKITDLAGKLGGQTTFPIREDLLTDDVINTLKPHGSVSVWNEPGLALPGDRSVDDRREELIQRGVDGVIDLRSDESALSMGEGVVSNFISGIGL